MSPRCCNAHIRRERPAPTYVFTDALPRTPPGKLQKFLLRMKPDN